ncbi:hypothetical protein Q361_10428 [Flavobacterium croceum DSM 17960]|jgi:uncharacterized membrane protein|uniref:DUF5808 domain-containing protein n=1 Tax=Flavobacterium croceum DSM 17960 TaxID=1121886 RepID=A0A2S4N9E1_9FLAO|nr:DUF5808 domain-containing protein [Flavobacterium croceum]POS02309.1 hypothetical protein Q361_10428 [Flavobacterium croceum DSM 17960]
MDKSPTSEQINAWRNDATNWKMGMFYYNKQDNRLFVDKKNPNLGFTLNFAHSKSYWFFVGAVLFFGLVLFTISLAG